MEPIVCANAAGIGIHHRLHGIFQLLGIEQTAGIIQKMFQFCQMRLNILFLRRLRLVFFQKFQNRLRSDLALCQSAGHVLLGTSAGNVSGGIQAMHCRGTLGIDPIAAGGMTAHNVRLCSLDLHILL